ncbi:hypothetical protein C2G38_2181687 [Gigaspora rosea]|uniref:Uncharacterized protein n=1 Tax=Gigaspora rosea TaxID=44941 RepID=A0A397VCN3_9GLOM|nr:hypothetical protein C2G38_2181687 [Gigaspora rosea]
MEKQPQRTQETFNFLNDIDLEIPEEEIPESWTNNSRPLRRIEHKIQTIEKSYKGFKYLSIFNKAERKIIAQKFGENPTIAELSKDDKYYINSRTQYLNLKFTKAPQIN